MRESPLKIAFLGLDEASRILLETAQGLSRAGSRELDCFAVSAVADGDAKLAQQFGQIYNCPAYSDFRQLIMQNQFDCLFVSAPLHACAEYIRMAIKKKFNIFMVPPLGRNYGEAAELVRMAESEKVSLVVANPGRFAKPALAMRAFLEKNPNERFFSLLAASGIKKVPDTFFSKWRNDPVLAGGGVILYDCWEIIDTAIWNFGLPQQVYCVAGSTSSDRQQRLYLTEDTAVITMKFNDYLCATLLAGRAAEAFVSGTNQQMAAQGKNILIKISDKSFEATDSQGKRLKREKFDDNDTGRIKEAMLNFGSNLISPQTNPLVSANADNLKVMAVIEAAYLSARTGMPEEPAKILKIA